MLTLFNFYSDIMFTLNMLYLNVIQEKLFRLHSDFKIFSGGNNNFPVA